MPFNTQFRVALAQRPEVASPVVVVSVPVSVTDRHQTVKTFRHSKKVRFKGTVTPAPGTPSLVVQKKRDGVWTTIATAGKWTVSASGVTFKKKVRIGKSGKFRLVAAGRLREVRRRRRPRALDQGAEVALSQHGPGDRRVAVGRQRQVAHVDALVPPVDERGDLLRRHVPVREEAVGDEVGERGAERRRVAEAR